MTSVTITPNRLTSSGLLDSSAAPDGGLLPVLLGRMDVSMVADGANLVGSAATTGPWEYNVSDGGNIKKYTDSGTPYARGLYTAGATCNNYIRFIFPERTEKDIYIKFLARKSAGGMPKFVKFYGQILPTNQTANTTFKGADYVLGEITTVSYGDGSGTSNDSTFGASYDTGYDSDAYVGRSGSLPRTFVHGGKFTAAEWGDGTEWHKFEFHVKFNSGTTALNEINDGCVECRIDGVMRCAAYNIFNRHYSNLPLNYVNVMDLVQGAYPTFTLDVKELTVSKYGWID